MRIHNNSLQNLKKGQIKPGEVRNPSGRGILEGTIRKALEDNDQEKLRTIVAGLIKQASPRKVKRMTTMGTPVELEVDGDTTAAQLLFDRGYGRPKQDVDIAAGEGLIIQVITGVNQTLELPAKDAGSTSN